MRKPLKRTLTLALTSILAATGAAISVPTAAQAAVADHVLYWNDVLLASYRTVGGAPAPLARAGAIMQLAVYDAANMVRCHRRGVYFVNDCIGDAYRTVYELNPYNNPGLETAIDYAAFTALKSLYPSLDFTDELSTAQAGIPVDASQQQARSIGEVSANNMISTRAADGSTDTTPYTPSTSPGYWRPTGSEPAVTPNWGKVTTFTGVASNYFRPPLPGGFGTMPTLLASSAYATQFNEAKGLGSATSTTRTATQTQIAWFWANDLDQTYKPPGQLYAHTRIVSAQRNLDQAGNAKLFALVSLAMADAAIAAWDAKYLTDIDLWRPETAIHLADTDGNSSTAPDTSWQPLSADRDGVHFSPAFPAYISGHATFAGAWAAAMKGYFGTDSVTFTATTDDPHALGVTRTFTTLSAAAAENARSRIYLGVHYQWDADFGVSTGKAVGDYVAANLLTPPAQGQYYAHYNSFQECDDDGAQLVYGYRLYNSYQCVPGSGGYDLYVWPWP